MTNSDLRTEMKAESRKLAGARVGIPPRQMDFRHSPETPRYFFGNNATATLFLAMLSGIFPPGERFFVESVRHFRDRIEDDTLKAQVSGFIGQEAIHGREHERLNQMLAERGIDTRVPEKAVRFALGLLEKFSPSTQLACTTLMEHFTALLGEELLTDERLMKQFDSEMLKMWQWHALEELEHKSVAFDVYEKIGNSHRERQFAPLLVAATVGPAALLGWAYLLAREGKLTDVPDVVRGIRTLFGPKGFVSRILPKMPLFSGRRFHPAKHDTRDLEQRWRDKLFGAQGMLNAEFRNRSAIMGTFSAAPVLSAAQ